MAARPSVCTGMLRRRGVAATDAIAGQAAAQMHPAPADSDAVAAGGLEVAGRRGQRSGVEVDATSHKPDSFLSRQSSLRGALAERITRVPIGGTDQGRAKRDCRRRRSPAEVSNATMSRDDTGWAPSASAAP